VTGAAQAGETTATVITEIRAALENEGELTALNVLGLVLRWTADTLRADSMRAPAAAFRAVAAADRAFAAAPALFAALELLIERGEPAEQVAADLSRYSERLATLKRQTEPLRNRLRALEEADARMRADIAARDRIGARIAELAAATTAAANARERFEQARAEAVTRLAALRRYAQADRDVGDALVRLSAEDEEASRRHAAIPRAMTALQEIEVRLAEVDAAPGDALAADTQAREQALSALRAGEPGLSHASAEEE
jgi:chromosome segregation ATPase